MKTRKTFSAKKHVVEAFLKQKKGFSVTDNNTTQCLLFPDIFCKPVIVQFDQVHGSLAGPCW